MSVYAYYVIILIAIILCSFSSFFPNTFTHLQQQMHAQQIPLTPHPIPTLAGSLGSFAGPMGLPHGPQALLKVPQDLHREDLKVPLGGPSAEERLVNYFGILLYLFDRF